TPSHPQGPAPDLGQHTAEILGRLRDGLSPWPSDGRTGQPPGTPSVPQSGAPLPEPEGPNEGAGTPAIRRPPSAVRKRPLEGITVLELASHYAAPYGVTLLGEMGARVIKVEPPTGDLLRVLAGEVFPKAAQGKESIAIDLKTEKGRAIFYRLVERADALMHNYRPGAPEKLGLDYESVARVNPRLVYLYAGSYAS